MTTETTMWKNIAKSNENSFMMLLKQHKALLNVLYSRKLGYLEDTAKEQMMLEDNPYLQQKIAV